MNMQEVSDALMQAEHHVTLGETHIASQQAIVAKLERDGLDTGVARKTLTNFEGLQAEHIKHRDRLIAKLATFPQK